MRILRRKLVGGKRNGTQVLVRSDLTEYEYEGEEFTLVGENFVIKSPN